MMSTLAAELRGLWSVDVCVVVRQNSTDFVVY